MKVTFSDDGWEDYLYWQAQDRKVLKRINQLIEDIARNENEGIGKPEPLRHEWAGWWSRRITAEHRLVYRVSDDHGVEVAVCRFHYGKLAANVAVRLVQVAIPARKTASRSAVYGPDYLA